MKMAVIIGVSHMTMGVVTKGLNQIYFNRPIVFVFEVITGLIILLGLFGWMDVLIIAKWLQPYNAYNYLLDDPSDPATYATY
jgi:V-type H+-transporting ATPase subunit a